MLPSSWVIWSIWYFLAAAHLNFKFWWMSEKVSSKVFVGVLCLSHVRSSASSWSLSQDLGQCMYLRMWMNKRFLFIEKELTYSVSWVRTTTSNLHVLIFGINMLDTPCYQIMSLSWHTIIRNNLDMVELVVFLVNKAYHSLNSGASL